MNSTVIWVLVVILVLLIAVIVFLLTKETPKEEFSFQIENLGMSIEKTKPVETYTLRDLETIEPPTEGSQETTRDYLNKFIDFSITWTNPSSELLPESVAYVKLYRKISNTHVYNYYTVNTDLDPVDIPDAGYGETNIVYKPTSVGGKPPYGDSDAAASAIDSTKQFFTPGAEVKLMLYGYDLLPGIDLASTHTFKLYYLVKGEVERVATMINPEVSTTVNNVQLTSSLNNEQVYLFDFTGAKQTSVISFDIVFNTFGEEFTSAEDSVFNNAGTIFRMCFTDRGIGSMSYKWLLKDGNNITVQNTSFRYGDNTDTILSTDGGQGYPNFNDPNICRFKVISTDVRRGGIKLGIDNGFLKYNSDPQSGGSVLTIVDDQSEGTTFYILKYINIKNLCYITYIPLDATLEPVFFAYDSINNRITTILQSQMDNLEYAGFHYIEELTELDNLDTILAVGKSIKNDDTTYRSSFNLISYTEKLAEPVPAYNRLNGEDVGSSVYRVNPFQMYTVRSVGIHNITGSLSELSEEYYNGDYIRFIFQKVNVPEYENVYQIKTKNIITQDLKQGATFQAQIDTQMYLQNHITGNKKFTLLTDTGDMSIPEYESLRLNVQVFSVPMSVITSDTEREIIMLLYDENNKNHIISYTENGVQFNDISLNPYINIDNYSIINK